MDVPTSEGVTGCSVLAGPGTDSTNCRLCPLPSLSPSPQRPGLVTVDGQVGSPQKTSRFLAFPRGCVMCLGHQVTKHRGRNLFIAFGVTAAMSSEYQSDSINLNYVGTSNTKRQSNTYSDRGTHTQTQTCMGHAQTPVRPLV